jgi:hypothetical protein
VGGGSGHGCAESVSVDYGRRDRPSSTRPRCVRCGTVVASDFSRPACAACERPNGAQQTTIAVSRQRHQSRTTSPRATNPRRYLPPTTPIPDTARPPHQSRRRPADGGTHHPHAPNGEGSPAPKFFWGWSGATPRGSHKNFFVNAKKIASRPLSADLPTAKIPKRNSKADNRIHVHQTPRSVAVSQGSRRNSPIRAEQPDTREC